jgi:hypothetical protein
VSINKTQIKDNEMNVLVSHQVTCTAKQQGLLNQKPFLLNDLCNSKVAYVITLSGWITENQRKSNRILLHILSGLTEWSVYWIKFVVLNTP